MKLTERAHQLVGLAGFREAGLPIKVAHIQQYCPYDRQYVLRMPVRVDGGDFLIPEQLEWLRGMFDTALCNQSKIGVDHPFCYVTVRHGLVQSKTDDEWHVDGFSTKVPHVPEQNYVWTDHTGTECADLAVEFPSDFDPLVYNVNHYLSRFVLNENIMSMEAETMYVMDPYILHRRPPHSANTMRTFVRISFVPIEINDVNNTQNPLIPRQYDADGVEYRNQLLIYSN